VAQGFSSNQKQLVSLIKAGIQHKGFSLINTLSPCVTFNKVNTFAWFKQKLVDLEKIDGYDPHDKITAMRTLMEHDEMVSGLVYQAPDTRSFDELLPGFREQGIVNQEWHVEPNQFGRLLETYR
jgi:2-oxoglutarate ferredoxin oxidoreductase subunit beta